MGICDSRARSSAASGDSPAFRPPSLISTTPETGVLRSSCRSCLRASPSRVSVPPGTSCLLHAGGREPGEGVLLPAPPAPGSRSPCSRRSLLPAPCSLLPALRSLLPAPASRGKTTRRSFSRTLLKVTTVTLCFFRRRARKLVLSERGGHLLQPRRRLLAAGRCRAPMLPLVSTSISTRLSTCSSRWLRHRGWR